MKQFMKRIVEQSVLALIIVFFTSFNVLNQTTTSKPKYKIVGYVAGWTNWTDKAIDAEKLTHINYAFANCKENGELNEPSNLDAINFIKLNSLKKRNKDLKILISIGGWGADYFSNAALSDASRKRFALSAIAYMKKFNIDGIDIDWEYPGQTGGGNIFRAEDKQNFTLMLKTLREILDAESLKDGRKNDNKYLLTIATGGDKAYLQTTELGIAHQYLDFVNIMTYDLYNGLDKETGHHTGLFQSSKGDQFRNSTASAVQGHIKSGVPPNKIVLGLAFYGRGWEGVKRSNNGLFQPASGNHISLSYDSLKSTYINKNGFVKYWDDDAKAPYLWNEKKQTFISYADEESFTYKTNFVKDLQLGGVMFWEYSHDLKDGALLNKIYSDLNQLAEN
jgi:chitinase